MDKLTGVIKNVTLEYITVIVSEGPEETCGSCALYDTCHSNRKQNQTSGDSAQRVSTGRLLTIYDYPLGAKVGDIVSLEEAPELEIKGAFWAFIFPLILALGFVILLSHMGVSDIATTLILLGFFSLYGLVLYLCREVFKKLLYFKIISLSPCR